MLEWFFKQVKKEVDIWGYDHSASVTGTDVSECAYGGTELNKLKEGDLCSKRTSGNMQDDHCNVKTILMLLFIIFIWN